VTHPATPHAIVVQQPLGPLRTSEANANSHVLEPTSFGHSNVSGVYWVLNMMLPLELSECSEPLEPHSHRRMQSPASPAISPLTTG